MAVPGTHTLWNGRIGEIRPLIVRGLGGLFREGFCNTVDELVGVIENLLGVNGEATLQEEVVVDLTQPLLEVGVAGRGRLLTAGKTEQGGASRPKRKRNKRAFHAGFSGVVEACW